MSHRILWIGALCLLWQTGCATLPKTPTPAAVTRTYDETFQDVWEDLHRLTEDEDVSVVSQDKASGLLVFCRHGAHPARDLYFTVLVVPALRSGRTHLHTFARTRQGRTWRPVENAVFDALAGALTEVDPRKEQP